ncbi:hypothetical protein V6U89_21375 [Micromonospora sp. CPCC 206171]|uniref:hypothetical protein n=1 Tax=Micromonospora sp. CPCC 206171 TaxID=3122405 RepID=UPI002FF3E5C7
MSKPECVTHGPINGYEIREAWSFTNQGQVEGLRRFVLSCGCEHIGADIRAVDVVTEDQADAAGNDVYVIELQIIDFMEQPVVTWQETRDVRAWSQQAD